MDRECWNCTDPTLTPRMLLTQDTTLCPETYYMSNSIQLLVDGITLDCNGAVLIGSGGDGVYAYEVDGVTIKDCTLTNYDKAIYLRKSRNDIVINNEVYSNIMGLQIDYTSNNNLVDLNNIHDNTRGVYISASSINNNLTSNIMCSNTEYDIRSLGFNNQGDQNTCLIGTNWHDLSAVLPNACTFVCP